MFVHKDQSYVIKLLRKQIADLEDEKESVKRCIQDSYRIKTDELATLQSWMKKTADFIQTAHVLLEDVGKHGMNKCPVGLCLNPKSFFQLSKKAEQKCKNIAAHVQKGRGFSYIPLSYRQEKVAADRFEDFESRSSVLKDIMEAIRSPCINKIGFYGKPGMGKTMLVREVERRAGHERLFDAVLMATVGRNPDLPRIRDEIARVSNELKSLEASNSKQAELIEKKVFVILDDIREPGFSLELLGINGKAQDNVVSYKILLTSRYRDVVSSLSETQIEVGKLAWEDAWNLFKKIADDPDKSRGLPFYADKITKKCEELPIAVATLANALRGRNLIEWKTTLRKLQSSPTDQANPSQIPQSLHSAIELHYSGLKTKELQQTFLLCSLLGQNATIQNLLKYGIGLGLFPEVKSTEEARAQVLNLVTKLRDSSLLLDTGGSSYFDMHDFVRDFATSTASKEHGLLALSDDAPNNWSNMEAMQSIEWIYLSNGDTNQLPDELKCPKLTFFHWSKGGPSLSSRPNLFRDKEGLKVLSLSKMNFLSIPSSISLSKNLCTLCLDQVELGAVNIGTMLGELENLQVLSLAGSDIKELPKQMVQLAKLKLLDLSDCTQLKVILPDVLSHLSRLEELYMRNSFDRWAEGIEEHENQNASLAELKKLKLLTTIEVHIICNFQKIPEDLFSENLARFKVFLGDTWNYRNSSRGSSKLLKLKQDARISSHPSVRKLLKKTNELHLYGLIGVENAVNELDEEGFQELKYLFAQDALEIQSIISVEQAFPVLEMLVLRNLKNMKEICHGPLGVASFRKLRLVTIECCNKLKNLFSSSIARQLQQLQEIRVKDCSNMEEVVDDQEQETRNDAEEEPEGHKLVELISLQSLTLQHLPKLISFNSSCGTLTLFNKKVVFSNLEELQLSSIMVNSIWHTSMISCVEKLTKLIIHGCDNLEYLFSSSMARGLLKLRHLQVKECKRIRMIIITENEGKEKKLIFSELNFLLIENLQNLVEFHSGNDIVEFSSLKQLQVLNCQHLQSFITRTNFSCGVQPPFNEKVVFSSSLEELQLSSIMVNNSIWHTSMTSCVEKLTKLIIHGCDNLEYLFSSSMARGLSKLRHLQVKECKRIRMIIITQNEGKEENLIFSQLNFLLIENLQKLVEFHSGNDIIEFSSLKQLQVLNCQSLESFIRRTNSSDGIRPLFNEKVLFSSNLEELQLRSLELINTIWDKPMISCVEKLRKLIIHDCKNLKYLFSSSVSRKLEGVTQFLLPKLRKLELGDLPKLESICSERLAMVCDSLEWIIIWNCYSLRSFSLYLPLLENGQPSPPPSLKQIVVWPQDRWKSLKWDHPNAEAVLLPFCGSYHSFPFELVEGRVIRLEFTDIDRKNTWLLPSVRELVLRGCNNLRSLNDISGSKDAIELKVCEIWRCEDVECVLSSSINPLVQKLEVLELYYLGNLDALFEAEAITRSPLPPDTFSSLKTINVGYCHKIKKLFHIWMYLQSLEEIDIGFCKQMEEIIAWDPEEAGGEKEGVIQLILPKLKSLKLKELPALKSICSRRAVMVCDSLEEIRIWNCEGLRRIPLYLPLLDNGQPSPPPSLKRIKVWPEPWGESWWKSLEWDHPNAKDVLRRFREFSWW